MRTFPILVDLGYMLSAATGVLLAGRVLGLPPILSYMVAGLLLGPVSGLLGPQESVALFSELGIALLLFLVGLELSLARIRDVGATALSVGLVQVTVTTVAAAALATLIGFARADALVLGLALAFSSTVVVVKLLERSGGTGSDLGRTTIGILLVQDVVVVVALTAISGVGGGESGLKSLVHGLTIATAGMAALATAAAGGALWLLPRLLGWIAASAETLLVVSLTWCFAFILGAERFAISIELGAFISGLALAQLPYADELIRRVHPLANFFLAVFFVALGAGIDPDVARTLWPQAIVLSAFVLIAKPALVFGLLLWRKYNGQTAFLAGLTLGQVSEFGFLLVAVALASGVAGSAELASLIGLVGILTIGLSATLVPRGPAIYRWLTRLVMRSGLGKPRLVPPLAPGSHSEQLLPPVEGHVVVVGMNTLGRTLVRRLCERGEQVVAVDSDPLKLAGLPARTVFGNADSVVVLRRAGIERARLVVAAPQIEDVNALIAHRCHLMRVPVSVHAFDPSMVDELLEIGADHLMVPKLDGVPLVERELRRLGVMG